MRLPTRPQRPSLYNSLVQADRDVARALGDRKGRTVSRVIGDGLSTVTGIDSDTATHIGHAVMLVAAAEPRTRGVAGLALAGLFVAGLSRQRRHPRQRW